MNNRSIVKGKSKSFAIRIIRLYQYLRTEKREFVISKQLLRSGTSIGANVNEALCGISKKDFLAKIYISYKEAAECNYWLDLLYETGYLNSNEYKSINKDCKELLSILSSIPKTTRQLINT